MSRPDIAALRGAPKVALHDHLDGGIRPATLAELAHARRYDGFGTTDPEQIAALLDRSSAGHLDAYLAAFAHTTALLDTADALHRVAAEAVADLATDGVIYAEIRFAPALHTTAGLTVDQVVDTVTAGIRDGETAAHDTGMRIHTRLLLTAMRDQPASIEIAELAARHSERSGHGIVVGFDLAGPEAANPASRHRDAIAAAHDAGLGITIHAGEGAGIDSIADAIDAGADRLGHGCALAADITVDDAHRRINIGPTATAAQQLHIEACPTSNIHTGAIATLAAHPAQMLAALGYSVGINCDNRTMSNTTPTSELAVCADRFGWDARQLESAQLSAISAAFCDPDLAGELAEDIIMVGWEHLQH